MATHTLEKTQVIRATLAESWAFFSAPQNLARITPPSLGFRVLSPPVERIYAGMMIRYRVRPLLGIPVSWLSEITHVEEPHRFVDEQRLGPYRVWHHEHAFREIGNGCVELRDLVHYALPFGVLGDLFHPILVRPQLERIFRFREKAVADLFGQP